MSTRSDPDNVNRIASLISPQEKTLHRALRGLEDIYGPADRVSPVVPFDRTRYYEREMGGPLVRMFVSFERLMRPEGLAEMKVETDGLEDDFRRGGLRTVNVDPGYICLERLVLATGKNYTHRIYLSLGVFADLTLVYHRKSFRALPWTYPDYKDPFALQFFNDLRDAYKARIRGLPVEPLMEDS
jgi:hypothetical protein